MVWMCFLYFLWVKQIVGSVHPDLIPKKSQEKVPKKSLTEHLFLLP